ncbi:MAG: hypothetical protein M1818_007573 [Claussenomyces sp. TS43310]|nr:MAG: hypothetical protein M1818_007573 [Claussenomyces sp. TS43310]
MDYITTPAALLAGRRIPSSSSRCSSISPAPTTPVHKSSIPAITKQCERSGTMTRDVHLDSHGEQTSATAANPASAAAAAAAAAASTATQLEPRHKPMAATRPAAPSPRSIPPQTLLATRPPAPCPPKAHPSLPSRPPLSRSTTSYHAADVLSRVYDPSRDEASLDELLARPRLPRSPYERRSLLVSKSVTPATSSSSGGGSSSSTDADRAERAKRSQAFEEEIRHLRQSALRMEQRTTSRQKQ